jgi:arsenite methyltransferase
VGETVRFDETTTRRLEAAYLTPDVVAQRCAQLRVLEPCVGERIVDIGCGPGLFVAELAQSVGPSGRIVGLDVSPDALTFARRRCVEWPWVTFDQCDATALPVADSEFDAAISVQVLEYVADVDRALAEMHRVLRPGGRALVVESDWDALVLNADDAAQQGRILAAWRDHAAHQSLPRSLAQRLRAAGFDLLRRELLPMLATSLNAYSYASGLVEFIRAFAVRPGKTSESEAAAWVDDLRTVAGRGDLLFLLPRFVFLARKPA